MSTLDRVVWVIVITALFLAPVMLLATAEGLPLAHTGAFGEQGCNQTQCHRPEPLPGPGSGRVQVEVGPYIPGQKQTVQITITDPTASRWGFQLAARQVSNPQAQAGTFSVQDSQFVRVRCASGSALPCSGSELQYATHTSVGIRSGPRYSVDWTAPSGDVGPVIFTAAAVGADGDGSTNGDRSFTTTTTSLYAPSNQPVLTEGGVVTAAFPYRLPSGLVGHGSLVTIFGAKFGPPGYSREVSPLDLVQSLLPTQLNRTGVDIIVPTGSSSSIRIPAYMLYVGEKQVNVQVPAIPGAFVGRVDAEVVFNRDQGANEIRSNRVSVNVQPLAPALFTFSDGRSAAAILSAVPGGVPVGTFAGARPAHGGDIILLYGTGFGQTQRNLQPGDFATGPDSLVTSVGVRIGGLALASGDILYAGAAPGFAGLEQFNIRIPSGLGPADLPIVLTAGGLETQAGVTLRVEP